MLAAFNQKIADACSGPAAELHERVVDCLARAAREPLLLPYVQKPGDSDNYARYLLHEDPDGRFSVFSLVWNKGQITPVHCHNYWCAYAVITGALTENFYAYDAATHKAELTGTRERMPGYACFHEPGLDIIHQLSNINVAPAISLHIYGITGAEPRRQRTREHTHFAEAKQINRLVETQ